MKKLFASVLIIGAVLFHCDAFGQAKADTIKKIRAAFKAINRDKSLKKVIKELDGTDRGAELTGFYQSGILVKMVSWTGVSDGTTITEYY